MTIENSREHQCYEQSRWDGQHSLAGSEEDRDCVHDDVALWSCATFEMGYSFREAEKCWKTRRIFDREVGFFWVGRSREGELAQHKEKEQVCCLAQKSAKRVNRA